MKKVILLSLWVLIADLVNAQRAIGYGRGSDWTGTSGSTTTIFDFLYFILGVLLLAGIFLLYCYVKEKFGRKEWSYVEFCNNHVGEIRCVKNNCKITHLVFQKLFGGELFVEISNFYYDMDDLRYDAKDLYIKFIKGKYVLYKK